MAPSLATDPRWKGRDGEIRVDPINVRVVISACVAAAVPSLMSGIPTEIVLGLKSAAPGRPNRRVTGSD